MGSFILGIKNAPSGSVYWWAEYGLIYSGWLGIGGIWNCPYGAYGATDLHILVVDSNYNVKHNKYGLGPIYDGRGYIYDCSTGRLSELAGTISRKELEYDGARASIPAYNIPQGKRGLVHVWGRNDMSTHQMVGMFWEVRDPDGILVERYGPDWEGMTAGEEDDFIGGRFDINKPGNWTITIDLLMNPDNPVVVDSYDGILCTVAAELVPTFSEFAVASFSKV